ncbi:hypothetical protein P4571_08005 [Niallia alba]|uniref:hypothetical protein n=1 Tax=Niallia alba TaxID=2729105 RepID=UPI002E213645|nr:hypothetical protein [Niallia alba]
MIKLSYVDLQILKHSLQLYTKRENAIAKDVKREENLLNKITEEVTKIQKDYQISKKKI